MTPILANVGIPMIFVQMPAMVSALIPVIIIEALLIRRWVSLSYRDAFVGITKANFVSTLVGVPVAWLAMFLVELVIMLPLGIAADKFHWKMDSPVFEIMAFFLSVAWLGPPPDRSAFFIVPAAAAVLLIPSFYVSVWIERRQCLKAWPSADFALVRRGVFLANLVSYGVLFLLACGWMGYEYFAEVR
jgi:hypothetical protein